MWGIYIAIFVLLLVLELIYFKIADRFNIIDKPNERSSHSTIVLRGGGIIFTISIIVWAIMMALRQTSTGSVTVINYLPFLIGLIMIAGVSFIDDIKSLPDSLRLVVQFLAILFIFWSMGIMHWDLWWTLPIAMFICVSGINIINFMDGINGITAGYSLVVLISLIIENGKLKIENGDGFIDESYLIVAILGVLVFCIFNFRPKGKAKCFAGDVGSVGIAFIILFAIGRLIFHTGDATYLVLLEIYGADGLLTISHRIMLHENLGQAHRKHAYQIMANELRIGHVKVSLLYMVLQLAVSLGFIYLCPNTILAHWCYLVGISVILIVAYIIFMIKYYPLHEAYLKSLKNGNSVNK